LVGRTESVTAIPGKRGGEQHGVSRRRYREAHREFRIGGKASTAKG